MAKKLRLRKKDIVNGVMLLVFIILIIFGVKGCISLTRNSVLANAPTINLKESARVINGVPLFEGDIPIEFSYSGKAPWKGFVEVVSDETYRQKKQSPMTKILPGRPLGGRVYGLTSNAPQTRQLVSWEELKRKNDTKYWMRVGVFTNAIQHSPRLDKRLYSSIGRIADGVRGRFVQRKETGTTNVFYVYNVGEFKPFYVSSLKSTDKVWSGADLPYLKLVQPRFKEQDKIAAARTNLPLAQATGETALTPTGTLRLALPNAMPALTAAMTTAIEIGSPGLVADENIYNAYVGNKAALAGFREAAKAFRGLSEAAQIRESVYLQALSQTIDDPNLIQDKEDIDMDGDTTEKVPYFQYWWSNRMAQLTDPKFSLENKTKGFINGELKGFRDFAEDQITGCRPLGRAELTTTDGSVVKLVRKIYEHFPKCYWHIITFWKPEPPAIEPFCLEGETGVCGQRQPHDALDKVTAEYLSFINIAEEMGLIADPQSDYGLVGIIDLAEQWKRWIKIFYYAAGDLAFTEPEGDSSLLGPSFGDDGKNVGYYYVLENLLHGKKYVGLYEWINQLNKARSCLLNLPGCTRWCGARGCSPYCGGRICNPKCKIWVPGDGWRYYYSPTGFISDEMFRLVREDIKTNIARIEAFQPQIESFYGELKTKDKLFSSVLKAKDYGGVDPITYSWHDSRCPGKKDCHSVEVTLAFRMPRIQVDVDDAAVHLKIVNDTGDAVVKITRRDPANRNVGILGKWNPFSRKDYTEVVRVSRSKYSSGSVSLSGTK